MESRRNAQWVSPSWGHNFVNNNNNGSSRNPLGIHSDKLHGKLEPVKWPKVHRPHLIKGLAK